VIHVLQEQVQGQDPLFQARFQPLPGTGGDDSREGVEGEQLLHPLVVLVDGEGDAVISKASLGKIVAPDQLLLGKPAEAVMDPPVLWSRPPRGRHPLVVERAAVVAGEEVLGCTAHLWTYGTSRESDPAADAS